MALKKICTAGGHSKAAPGAKGYLDEYTEDRKVNKALQASLKAYGYNVKDASNERQTQGGELAEEVRICNAFGADFFAAVHFNASKKTKKKVGVEVFYYAGSATGKKYAAAVAKDLAALLGLPNRGAKASKNLYVLRKTNAPAILVEVCFVDSKADAAAYKAAGATKVGQTIAAAIHKTNGGKVATKKAAAKKATTTTAKKSTGTAKGYRVKVTANALNVRAGAGTKYRVNTTIKKGGVYTIVQTKNGWGKLKSGAGWIKLSYTKKI